MTFRKALFSSTMPESEFTWPVTGVYRDYPAMAAEVNRVEPAPRRVRGWLGGEQIFDTSRARYVWEWPNYPQYYIPVGDIGERFLIDEGRQQQRQQGIARRFGLHAGGVQRPGAAWVFTDEAIEGISGTVRFRWDGLDAWYEEDEQIFVHPRNPYVRVDALRSHRHVRVELDGLTLAESHTPILVFETGLPTRYYLDRTDVALEHLRQTDTQAACPYKGVTTGYWSFAPSGREPRAARKEHRDVAWCYDFPTRQLLPIAGLIAFYNEKVDLVVDGVRLERPRRDFVG